MCVPSLQEADGPPHQVSLGSGTPFATALTTAGVASCKLAGQGDLEGALKEYLKALDIQEREASNSLTAAMCYNKVGSVLWEKGESEGVMKQFPKALEIQEHEAPNSLTAAT